MSANNNPTPISAPTGWSWWGGFCFIPSPGGGAHIFLFLTVIFIIVAPETIVHGKAEGVNVHRDIEG